MEKMPLAYVKGGKVIDGNHRFDAIKKLKELGKEYGHVYVMDLDGVKRNRPNLSVYRKLSHKPFLWIDSLPRDIEDVMDVVIVGAERITIGDILSDDKLGKIRDMCDIEIFLRGNNEKEVAEKAKKFGFDGVVIVSPKEKVDVPAWGVYPAEGIVKKLG